ncbi:MAG TPA: peptidylprolyl isomerase [Candidatus Moranbacteria bacterium]|nr:peptidylprolyl isomerase [Candidatus Moranbacteria bacterium]
MKNVVIVILAIIIIVLIAGGLYWFLKIKDKKVEVPAPVPIAKTETKEKNYNIFPGVLPLEQLQNKKAKVQLVTKGFFEIEIYPDVPKTASNFITLSRDKFYEKKVFYKVIPGAKASGGSKFVDGAEGVNYQFEDEIGAKKLEKGSVAMENSGPNTNGSRFFIVLGDSHQLENKYTIFGKIISGQDVVDRIQEGDMIESIVISSL